MAAAILNLNRHKKTISLAAFLFSMIFGISPANAQIDVVYHPQVGIPVSQKRFNQMVGNMLTKMKNPEAVSINDMIKLVRIENTIEMDQLTQRKSYTKFEKLFKTKYSEMMIKRLNARVDVGMSFYSPNYKIFWGGKLDSNSKYRIIKIHHHSASPNVGINISQAQFNYKVSWYVDFMKLRKDLKSLSVENVVEMIRIANTLRAVEVLSHNWINHFYYVLFNTYYVKQALNEISARRISENAYYSAKYRINWLGAPDNNSIFRIVDLIRLNQQTR